MAASFEFLNYPAKFCLVGCRCCRLLFCAAQLKAVSVSGNGGRTVQHLKAKLEKLRAEADDCELIGRLATDIHKRELFLRLAVDLRDMARDIEAMIATHPPVTKSGDPPP